MAESLSSALAHTGATRVSLRVYQNDKWRKIHTFESIPNKAEVEALAQTEGRGRFQVQIYKGTSFLTSRIFYVEGEAFGADQGDVPQTVYMAQSQLVRDTLQYAAKVNEKFAALAERADKRIQELHEKLLSSEVSRAEAEADPINDLIKTAPALLAAVIQLKRGNVVGAVSAIDGDSDPLDRL
tara:strand:+ start:1082 stop:1630 length:549 start_codon:yes stop_codon:yes gene_type:complete